jgi:hypothetical protein
VPGKLLLSWLIVTALAALGSIAAKLIGIRGLRLSGAGLASPGNGEDIVGWSAVFKRNSRIKKRKHRAKMACQ